MLTEHMHSDLEVKTGGHIDSEVVCLNYLFGAEDLWVHLDEGIVVEQLMNVRLLLLPQCKREAGTGTAAVDHLGPCLVVLPLHTLLSQEQSEVSPRRQEPRVPPGMRRALPELDSILASVDFSREGGANGAWDWLAVISVELLQLKDEARPLGVHPEEAGAFDSKGDVVGAVGLVQLDRPREQHLLARLRATGQGSELVCP